MIKKPKILWFDLETAPYLFYGWGLGKQVVRHHQLHKDHCRPRIICVTYCWNDGKKAQCIDWGYEEQNTAQLVEQFDEIIKQADHIIGKNNRRFDDKVLNAARMFAGLPGMPDWFRYTDDLEQHLRRYFRLPSYSLDYVSGQFGLGGKIKMEMQDWIDIVEKNENGQKALKKMIKYGKKDVEDTRALWNRLCEHFEPKFNVADFHGRKFACKNCGSYNVVCNGSNGRELQYQQYRCKDCNRYAGRRRKNSNGRLI